MVLDINVNVCPCIKVILLQQILINPTSKSTLEHIFLSQITFIQYVETYNLNYNMIESFDFITLERKHIENSHFFF